MAQRPAGPDPPKAVWTSKRVVLWMVSAWAQGRRPAFQGKVSTVRSALDWCGLYLPIGHAMRDQASTYLLTWIWARAEKESFRDVCRRRGWSFGVHRTDRPASGAVLSLMTAVQAGRRDQL